MFRKQSSLLVLCLFCLAAALAKVPKVPPVSKVPKVPKLHFSIKPNAHIAELQSESRELAATHADVSSACFFVYKPILENVATQYETNYGACVVAYDKASSLINAIYAPVRDDIVATTTLTCNACCRVWTAEDVDLDILVKRVQCAADVSAENSKILYSLSANATENAVKIQEEYISVNLQRTICVNNAERDYVQDTTNTYEQLNACLRGEQSVPTPETVDTTPRGDFPDPPALTTIYTGW